jgi:tRNA A-37 threonylcarbamoyl transferase component Bud32
MNLDIAQRIVKKIGRGWPKPVKRLGSGLYGVTYVTNNGRVMKFENGNHSEEYKTLLKLQGTHVVPRFKNGNGVVTNLNKLTKSIWDDRIDKMTVFIMGRAGGDQGMTLRKYLRTHPSANIANIHRRLEYIVSELHTRGVSHRNLHNENIIVTTGPSGRITGMWVIDFGSSTTGANYKRNLKLVSNITNKSFSPSFSHKISARRTQIANIMKQYKSPTRSSRGTTLPKAKSVSPRRTPRSPRRTPRSSPPRPRSAPARIATPQKGLKVRFSLKRKRA